MIRSISPVLIASALLLLIPITLRAQSAHEAAEDAGQSHAGHSHSGHGDASHGDASRGDSSHGESSHHGHGHQGSETDYQHHTMAHDFSGAEEWAARFDSPERMAWQKPAEVVEMLAVEPGMTVVDLGAGTGYFLSYLSHVAGEGGRVLALDPEPDMVRFMSERAERENLANVESKRIPFDDPELEPASVDRVLIVNTWHHISERSDYARKLLAALKPGGGVYIVDFTHDSPSGPPVSERLSPEQVITELAGGGFEAEMLEETLPRQYVVVGRRSH